MANEQLRRRRELTPSPSGSGQPMTRAELVRAVNEYIGRTTGRQAFLDVDTLARYERGHIRWPNADYRDGLRAVLGVSSDAALGFHPTRRGRSAFQTVPGDRSENPAWADGSAVLHVADGVARLGAGRYFAAVDIGVVQMPAGVQSGALLLAGASGRLGYPGQRLVVASVVTPTGPRLFGLDPRAVGPTSPSASGVGAVRVPEAYELDVFTSALLWAAVGYDLALLDDDTVIADALGELSRYEDLPSSTVSDANVDVLSSVSRMWLGSRFCAEHIVRHSDSLSEVPSFWTREQRGEEASSWLLFRHKIDYLTAFAGRGREAPRRTFCIPEAAVNDSSLPERVLMFLAIALMESFGIVVDVGTEPGHAGVPGFVTDGAGSAIVANWVGTDDLWHVDVADSRTRLREFSDMLGAVGQASLTRRPDPRSRLQAVASYLGLDWSWLIRRSRDLAQHGTAKLVRPRSRLLSMAGVDRACAFVGGLDPVAAR